MVEAIFKFSPIKKKRKIKQINLSKFNETYTGSFRLLSVAWVLGVQTK